MREGRGREQQDCDAWMQFFDLHLVLGKIQSKQNVEIFGQISLSLLLCWIHFTVRRIEPVNCKYPPLSTGLNRH